MRPEQQIQQAQRPIRHADVMMNEATPLDDIAARLGAAGRYWNNPDREPRLAEGVLTRPRSAQHNRLSAYADPRISAWESAPGVGAPGGRVSLTGSLAASLTGWRDAA